MDIYDNTGQTLFQTELPFLDTEILQLSKTSPLISQIKLCFRDLVAQFKCNSHYCINKLRTYLNL